MDPNAKIGEQCFLENIRLFGDQQTMPEQYNLYNGLRAMSVTLASLAQVVDNVERQCNSIAQQMHRLDRKIDNTENSR
jgi:hypothetical protein